MKKLKINENLLGKVLGQVMIEPSIIKYLKGGNIYALGSDWNLELQQENLLKELQEVNDEIELYEEDYRPDLIETKNQIKSQLKIINRQLYNCEENEY